MLCGMAATALRRALGQYVPAVLAVALTALGLPPCRLKWLGVIGVCILLGFFGTWAWQYAYLSGYFFRRKAGKIRHGIAALVKEFEPCINRYVFEPVDAEAEIARARNEYHKRFYKRLKSLMDEGVLRGCVQIDSTKQWLHPQSLEDMKYTDANLYAIEATYRGKLTSL
jgi:hypothetical protein